MRKRFTTTLEEEIIRELKIMAISEDKDVSELIPEMLRIYKWYRSFYEKQIKKT